MIKIENHEVMGWEHAIRGMRNPLNSWDKSDSYWTYIENPQTMNTAKYQFFVGEEDLKLMKKLAKAGSDHAKFRRMIVVYLDITAPLYWWKEFDTYKVGTVANSCSTMHKIHAKEFEMEDFSCEHLVEQELDIMQNVIIKQLNRARKSYKAVKEDTVSDYDYTPKDYWWQMIQMLPTSYNQKRTILLNYEVLANMYRARRNHKLDEWHTLCDWIESLPYSELITGEAVHVDE